MTHELQWHDDLTAVAHHTSGVRVQVTLGALPDWKVASRITARDPLGRVLSDQLQIWDDDATARDAVAEQVRRLLDQYA
jgi:hypothetical protein